MNKFFVREFRFDDIITRTDRKMYNKLASIRIIFDELIQRYQDVHIMLGKNAQSMKCLRDKSSLRQCMQNRENKYGTKIQALSRFPYFFLST